MCLIADDDTLTASTVAGTGQTGSPLPLAEPEVEDETDLFLNTIAKTLWGLLCVLDIGFLFTNIGENWEEQMEFF